MRLFSFSGGMKSFGGSVFQSVEFKLGCAESCRFRKAFGIPPFGKWYVGKFKGEVK